MSKTTKIIIAVAGLFLLNWVVKQFTLRFDLTKNKEFTLSKATKDIISNLDDKVQITSFFSDNLPTDIDKTRQDLKDLLSEYANRSKGKLDYNFIAPNEDSKLQDSATAAGIQPVMINVREKDQQKQQKAFLGVVVKMAGQQEVIPVIQPGTAMEYALTTSIKKLAVKNKPIIGFIQGHGEAAIQELAQAYQSLSILYNVESVYISDSVDLSKYNTLVMVRPKDSIPPTHFMKLDEFMASGKNVLIALNQVNADLQQGMAMPTNIGVSKWLATKGIEIEDALVRDIACGQVQVQQQSSFFSFATPVQFPYLPLIQQFPDHPVTKGLERVILQFASPINYKGDNTKKFISLLYTSDQAAREKVPLVFDINHQWTRTEFPEHNICVGAAIEGKLSGSIDSKLIVFGDGDFPVGGGRGKQINEDNVSLFVNGIDWLSDDTGLIDLRTKAVETRPIKDLDDATRSMYKYLNFLLPILLVIVYGIFRSSMSRKKRVMRMEERYS